MQMVQWVLGTASFSTPLANFGWLVLRLFSGLAMSLAHGLGKFPPSERFIGVVENLGFPAPALFAWLAGFSEAVGGVFIALGLFTRPMALMLAITMGVAAFLQHGADPFRDKELALLYLAVFIAQFFVGGGRWSVDAFLSRRWGTS